MPTSSMQNEASICMDGFAGTIGVAREDITPPAGIYARCWGASDRNTADGVHRPLLVNALVFAAGTKDELVLLTLDLVTWRSVEDEGGIRHGIREQVNLRTEQLMVHLAHNHAAPATMPEMANLPEGKQIPAYREKIIRAGVSAIQRARKQAQTATLSWSTGTCQLAQNRDFPDPQSGRIVCGINPQNSADDTLLVGRICDETGKVLSVLVNYACHPTSLGPDNTKISPDYIGALRETVEQHYPGALCLFLHGASGELAPMRTYEGDPKVADQNGREIAYAALGVLQGMLPAKKQLTMQGVLSSGADLGVWALQPISAPLTLRQRSLTLELPFKELPDVVTLQQQIAECSELAIKEQLERALLRRRFMGNRSSHHMPVMIWQAGRDFFVATPAEAHSDLQISLRASFTDRHIAVMNITNGYASYLPPAKDYPTESYQVEVSLFKQGALEALIEEVHSHIGSMIEEERANAGN